MAFLRDVEYDPFTGITKKWYFDGDKLVCHKTWEEDSLIAFAADLRNTRSASFINNPHPMHHMAMLSPIVIEKIMKEHGINVMGDMTDAEQKKLYRIIETEYPWCKTHEAKLWRSVRRGTKNP